VTSVHRNNRCIVSVVLGGASAGERDARMRALIEAHIASASTRHTATAIAQAAGAKTEKRATEAKRRLLRPRAVRPIRSPRSRRRRPCLSSNSYPRVDPMAPLCRVPDRRFPKRERAGVAPVYPASARRPVSVIVTRTTLSVCRPPSRSLERRRGVDVGGQSHRPARSPIVKPCARITDSVTGRVWASRNIGPETTLQFALTAEPEIVSWLIVRAHRPKAEPQEPEVARTLWGGTAAEWFSLVPSRNHSAKFIA
jgi:hypothetical protein